MFRTPLDGFVKHPLKSDNNIIQIRSSQSGKTNYVVTEQEVCDETVPEVPDDDDVKSRRTSCLRLYVRKTPEIDIDDVLDNMVHMVVNKMGLNKCYLPDEEDDRIIIYVELPGIYSYHGLQNLFWTCVFERIHGNAVCMQLANRTRLYENSNTKPLPPSYHPPSYPWCSNAYCPVCYDNYYNYYYNCSHCFDRGCQYCY